MLYRSIVLSSVRPCLLSIGPKCGAPHVNRENRDGVPRRRQAVARDPHRLSALRTTPGGGVGWPASVHTVHHISSTMVISTPS